MPPSWNRSGALPQARARLEHLRDPVAGPAAGGWVPGPRPPEVGTPRQPMATARPHPGAVRDQSVPAAPQPGASTAELPDPDPGDTEPPNHDPGDGLDGDGSDAHASGSDDPAPGTEDPSRSRLLGPARWGRLAERWVPEQLHGARIDPGRRGAVVISLVAALAAVVAAVGAWWQRPSPSVVAPAPSGWLSAPDTDGDADPSPTEDGMTMVPGAPDPAAAPASSGPRTGTADAAPSGPLLISVTGRVRDPGVVTVPVDARVIDAIAAAGGALDPGDLTGMNLAQPLTDGASVVVGPAGGTIVIPTTAGAAVAPGAGAGPIDINLADESGLEQLPGIGPVTAAAIVSWRDDNGPFASVEALQAVPGIGPATMARLAPLITVG